MLKLEATAEKFTRQAHRSLRRFQETLHDEVTNCCTNSHVPTRHNCVIELYNHWSEFCKQLLINSARGGFQTRSGGVLLKAPGLPLDNDVISFLRTKYRNRPIYWEPNWTISIDFIDACIKIDIANLSDVIAAIASTGSPSEQLRRSRHYLAHRNKGTATLAINELSIYGATLPLDIDQLIRKPVRAGANMFEVWVLDLTAIAFSAC